MKIRHIGFLTSRSKKENLAKARDSPGVPAAPPKHQVTTREIIQMTTGKDPYLCPACGKGEMVIIAIIPPIRGFPLQKIFRSIPWDRKVFFGSSSQPCLTGGAMSNTRKAQEKMQ